MTTAVLSPFFDFSEVISNKVRKKVSAGSVCVVECGRSDLENKFEWTVFGYFK